MKRLLILVLAFVAAPVFAHKLAPSLLDVEGQTANQFAVMWRTPAVSGSISPEPIFPPSCSLDVRQQQAVGTSMERHWLMKCPDGLEGETFKVMGLTASRTAALLKIDLADGRSYSQLLRRDGQAYTVPREAGTMAVVWQYFVLGIEHILIGVDHLLFVTGLLLLAATWKQLLVTVTAFTVGHSITLACVSLGVIPEVASWVELAIAATILYLALELSYKRMAQHSGRVRWPVIALFGLIHGLGFASVLDELGLPQNDLMAGLVAFNIGIEVGQLLFVATLALLIAALGRLSPQAGPVVRSAAVYGMGGMAVFWCLDRAEGLLLSSFYFF